ncbi:MAG: DUF3427 domain-containing protein [Planctomycetota bacterium]
MRRGLYERLITTALARDIQDLDKALEARTRPLRSTDAADRIALHVRQLVQRVIDAVSDRERVAHGIEIARAVIQTLAATTHVQELADEAPSMDVLAAVLRRLPTGATEEIAEPLIPLLDTVLLTNASAEPRVGQQLTAEIASANGISLIMAFIRRSGIRPMLDALRRHCDEGRSLRVLTTIYTGSTEAEALEALAALGGEVRVSYDTSSTRLHAKAWLFHRSSGFSTAYIGSSNLTHSAQVSGLEWNVRLSEARNPEVVRKIGSVFEAYWNTSDFELFDAARFRSATSRGDGPGRPGLILPLEIHALPFQARLLEQIELSRSVGHHRNLLVSATGTGKTVMAALDYVRLRDELRSSRLLFIAHRQEILQQSLATFRQALRDPTFGELWVAGDRPTELNHVFASIQSLSGRAGAALMNIPPTHFDVVIIDEFHHAAASSYNAVLDHLKPLELLGLTATPERADGLPILQHFDGRIAAELRLWDAIDQQRLCPFVYYGISDTIDLRDIPWRRGRGYDVAQLSKVLTANDAYGRHVLAQTSKYVDDVHRMRALGFCVSVDHARFMARIFTEAGLGAAAVWGDSTSLDRRDALRALADGRIQALFSVDLFNEGVDVPRVDALLLLRPTDSPTLFLQQLGRGLRKSAGKTFCTVLDFVGEHRREFRMDRRLRALLGGTRKTLLEQVGAGFPFLPAGCHMELDRIAKERVLQNIKAVLPSRFAARAAELANAQAQFGQMHERKRISLGAFLEESGYELDDIYDGRRGWSDLQEAAKLDLAAPGPLEGALRKGVARLLHVNDRERLAAYREFASRAGPLATGQLPTGTSVRKMRLLRMLVGSVCRSVLSTSSTMEEGLGILAKHPQIRSELRELCDALQGQIDHLEPMLDLSEDVPLRLHARYTRDEILAAFGVGEGSKVAPWQSGVLWVESAKADLFAFTLNKSKGNFSPTTSYRDYAISRDLIHWESQNTTREDHPTGRRYRSHAEMGTHVVLFARLDVDDRAFWCLGPATYVSHEGECPMAITWRLRNPLPGDLFVEFAAAVA